MDCKNVEIWRRLKKEETGLIRIVVAANENECRPNVKRIIWNGVHKAQLTVLKLGQYEPLY